MGGIMNEDIFGSEEKEKKAQDAALPETDEEAKRKMIEEGKAAAMLGYIPFMCFVPLIKMKDNPFAFRHGKQGLVLFIIEILAVVFLLPKISDLIWSAVIVLCLAAAVAGIIFSLQGQDWKIPLIGDWADKLKI
jgi:fumarate reductase subunit D